MSFEKFVTDHAVAIMLAILATIFLMAAYFIVIPAKSQSIEIGPGGVTVERRGGEDSHRYVAECRALLRNCKFRGVDGERDEESCARYRESCRWDR